MAEDVAGRMDCVLLRGIPLIPVVAGGDGGRVYAAWVEGR